MAFTDPFIRRPVLASVVSLLIVLLGFQAWSKLPIRQYPQMENALITVTTAYPGPTPKPSRATSPSRCSKAWPAPKASTT